MQLSSMQLSYRHWDGWWGGKMFFKAWLQLQLMRCVKYGQVNVMLFKNKVTHLKFLSS